MISSYTSKHPLDQFASFPGRERFQEPARQVELIVLYLMVRVFTPRLLLSEFLSRALWCGPEFEPDMIHLDQVISRCLPPSECEAEDVLNCLLRFIDDLPPTMTGSGGLTHHLEQYLTCKGPAIVASAAD